MNVYSYNNNYKKLDNNYNIQKKIDYNKLLNIKMILIYWNKN